MTMQTGYTDETFPAWYERLTDLERYDYDTSFGDTFSEPQQEPQTMTSTNDKYNQPIIIYEGCHDLAFSTVGEEGDKTYSVFSTKTGEHLGFAAQWTGGTYTAWGTNYIEKLERPVSTLHEAVMTFND